MFVAAGAQEKLRAERRERFYTDYVERYYLDGPKIK